MLDIFNDRQIALCREITKKHEEIIRGKISEVLDIVIPKNFETKKLMDLKLPVRAVIGIVNRNKRVIIPKGNTLIMGGDEIIVFTKNEEVQKLKDFFKVS